MKKQSNSFAVIMETFEKAANNPKCDPTDYADALTDFATACARSVLKKVIDPKSKEKTENGKYILRDRLTDGGCNPLLIRMRADLARDARDLARLMYASDNATDLVFDTFGDLVHETVDAELASAAADLLRENLADGLDLVNDAVVAILDEMQKQREREPKKPIDFERPYTIRRIKRKVWIKESDSKAVETVETAPVREIYRAIRQAIASSRAVQADPRNGYSYLSDLVQTDDNSDPTVVYYRLPKYADLGGAVRDFNGKETGYTTDRETVDRYNSTLAALNLTDRQALVLRYRLQGYGYKAIGTRLGIHYANVNRICKQIQAKAVAIGFSPDLYNEMTASE